MKILRALSDGKIFGLLVGTALALSLTMGGCGSTPEGRANKAAGKQESPAAGRVIAKTHEGSAYWLLLKKGGKSRTIYVTAAAWKRCHVDRWYPTCKK